MFYTTRYVYPKKYEYAGTNQHGDRFKLAPGQCVNSVMLTAEFDCATDLAHLIYLSSKLGVPIIWNAQANPQTAGIEIISAEVLKKAGVI